MTMTSHPEHDRVAEQDLHNASTVSNVRFVTTVSSIGDPYNSDIQFHRPVYREDRSSDPLPSSQTDHDDSPDGKVVLRRGAKQWRTLRVIGRDLKECGHPQNLKLISFMTTGLLGIITLSLATSSVLETSHLEETVIQDYLTLLFCLGSVWIVSILILGAKDKLTDDYTYMEEKSNSMNFQKLGVAVFGAGTIIYDALRIEQHINWSIYDTDDDMAEGCVDSSYLINSIAQITFTALQIYLFFIYSKIRINKNRWVAVLAKFGMMMLFGINLSVWLSTLVEEVREEISEHKHREAETLHGTTTVSHYHSMEDSFPSVEEMNSTTLGPSHTHWLECSKGIQSTFSPYLYPCVIEHSLLSASMVYIIWTKVGEMVQMRRTTYVEGTGEDDDIENRVNISAPRHLGSLDRPTPSGPHHKGYFTSHLGTYAGFLLLCFTLMILMMYLYNNGQERKSEEFNDLFIWRSTVTLFVADLVFNILSIVMTIFTYIRMSPLAKKNGYLREMRHRRERRLFSGENQHQFKMLDKALMGVSYLGVLGHTILTLIAGIFGSIKNTSLQTMVMVSSCLDIIGASMQTVFIVAFALPRRSIKAKHALEKPGRQGLIFLQIVNFCLWTLDTFALGSSDINLMQRNFYSFTAWAILSTLTFPLVIWFRFHSVVVLADVVNHSYTEKYVGLNTTKRKRGGVK